MSQLDLLDAGRPGLRCLECCRVLITVGSKVEDGRLVICPDCRTANRLELDFECEPLLAVDDAPEEYDSHVAP